MPLGKICDDGNLICGRDDDGQIQLSTYNLSESGNYTKLEGLNEEITSYVVSPKDNSTHTKVIGTLALNHGGTRLATGSSDSTIRIWHIGPGEGFVASCKSHSTRIVLLRFHPTKPLLISAALGELSFTVWNTETGELVTKLDGHQGKITDVAFLPSGKQFATCAYDKVIIIWSSETLRRVKTIPAFECIQSLAYLPPGALKNYVPVTADKPKSLLVSGGQWGIVRVWDTDTSHCVLEVRGPTNFSSDTAALKCLDFGLHSIESLSVFPISSISSCPIILALTRASSHVELFNADSFKLFYEFTGEIGSVDQLCLMGAMKTRLVLADVSANLKLFSNPPSSNATDGASWSCQLVQSPHTGVIGDMVVSNCGLFLLTGGHDQGLGLWKLEEPENESGGRPKLICKVFIPNAHDAHISAVCFARNMSVVFSGSTDGVLKSWTLNTESSESSKMLQSGDVVGDAHEGAINCIHVSANGRSLATGSRDKTAKLWSLDGFVEGKNLQPKLVGVLKGHSRGVWSVRFSEYDRILLTASGDHDLRLWNLKNLSCVQTFEGHGEPVYRAEFISKGRQILSCDQRGLVRLWNLSKKNDPSTVNTDQSSSNVIEAHNGRIWALAVCPNESGFYTGGEDATICFFRDTSNEVALSTSESIAEHIKTDQEFQNLLKNKKYRRAFYLAVKLDKPQKAYEILEEITLMEGLMGDQPAGEMRPLEAALFGLIPKPLALGEPPSEEFAQRLLKYAVQWNTRARTCLIAQRVFNWVISNWAPERLLTWPGIGHAISGFIPYTARHYQRLNRLEEQMTVMDYLFDTSRCNQLLSLEYETPKQHRNSDATPMEVDGMES
nr:transducin beta protein 3 [Hymenolepis microstoma]